MVIKMNKRALFGPAGNSASFAEEGYKHSYQQPAWLFARGLDAYEYAAGNGITGGIDTFRKIGEEAKKYNIRTSFHAPYFISLSGTDLEKRLKSIDYIRKSVEMADAMGADIIVIHTGSASKISREEAVNLAKDTMYKALSEVGGNVKMGLETMGKVNQLGTLEEVLDICSLDGRLCPVVDFGHMNARNAGGLFTNEDDYLRVFDKISDNLGAEYAENLHCHFSKIEYTKAGEKMHLTLEDTVFGPPFEPLMNIIAKNELAPRIICESRGTMAEDAKKMKDYYTSII